MVVVKKKKNKKRRNQRRCFFLLLILLIIVFYYVFFRSKSYEKEYQVENYQVKEKYDSKLKIYTFEVQKEEKIWHFLIEHKSLRKKKLIQDIVSFEVEDTTCIIPKSAQLKAYPQCIKKDELIDYHLINEEMKEKLGEEFYQTIDQPRKNYEKITLKNLDNNTYYIWNYKGFYKINAQEQKNINIFPNDIYDISNVTFVNQYLLIPDYKESYYFNQFYIINMKNASLSNWELKESLYFDGYYLGSHSNSLFYVDRKTKTEWELWPKKKRIRKIGTEKNSGKILKNGNWEKISLTKLVSDTYQFEKEETYHYEIDQGLYVTYSNCQTRKKISEKNIKEIVAVIKDKVYYLVGDSLYYYTERTGEVELMTYFEWNFNYKNMIFVYAN